MNMFSAKAMAKTMRPVPQSQARALAVPAALPALMARDRIWPERQPRPIPAIVRAHGFGVVVANAATNTAPQKDAIPILSAVAEILLITPGGWAKRARQRIRLDGWSALNAVPG